MHRFFFFDNEIASAEAHLSAVSSAALYGRGIFTTLAISGKKTFLWEKHWKRLIENAAKIELDVSNFAESVLKNVLDNLIEKNKIIDGRARITFYDAGACRLWDFSPEKKTSLLITTAERRSVPKDIGLTVSRFPINSRSPLAGVKSCNYLDNILALENAKSENFDEAIRINEKGEMVSACMANVFWLKDERLFTPSLKTGCLAGTTREFILENQEVFEVEADLATLKNADLIFLTSSGIGVVQARFFEDKKFTREVHEMTRILQNSFKIT